MRHRFAAGEKLSRDNFSRCGATQLASPRGYSRDTLRENCFSSNGAHGPQDCFFFFCFAFVLAFLCVFAFFS